MSDMLNEFSAGRELLINMLLPLCDPSLNWGQLYKRLSDKQLHFSRPESFGKRINDAYITTCLEMCEKHGELGMTTHPMISIGLQHRDALYIIRKLAGQFDQSVTCQCLSVAEEEVEEGEIVNDNVFNLIESFTSNAFLFNLCIYDEVCFYSVSNI